MTEPLNSLPEHLLPQQSARPSVGDSAVALEGLGTGAQRAGTVGVLVASMGIPIVPLISLGVLAPLLIPDLGISRGDLGLLTSLGSGVNALLSPVAGAAVDRLGNRDALLAVLLAGAASLAWMAAASSFLLMGVAIALAGVALAGANPATNRVIRTRLAHGSRGWITGLKQSGETIAITVAGGTMPFMARLVGWRGAVAVFSGVALAAAIASVVCVEGSRGVAVATGSSSERGVRPAIYWLSAYSFCMGAAGAPVTTYLALYAHDVGNLTVAAAGGVIVVAGAVGGVCRLLWSRSAEVKLGVAPALLALAILASASGASLLIAPLIGTAAFWVAAGLWGASGLAFGAVAMLAAISESEIANAGRAAGLTVLGFASGLTVTPPVFGWLVDHGYGYGTALGLVIGFYAAAVGVILRGRSSFRSLG